MAEFKTTLSVKVIRKKHVVTCFPNEDVDTIVPMLLSVPSGSVVDEFDVDDHGVLTITFHDEHVDNTK